MSTIPTMYPGLPTRLRKDVTQRELMDSLLRHCKASYDQNMALFGEKKAKRMLSLPRK